MRDPMPIYLPKLQSLRRGIRRGWYIVDDDGNPAIGPFPTREACMDQAAAGAMARAAHPSGDTNHWRSPEKRASKVGSAQRVRL